MPEESPANYYRDAPTEEEMKRGFRAAAEAFLANRDKSPEEQRAAIKEALKGMHGEKPGEKE
ncbi:MAG: hypothetical protein DMF67_16870 [Acidobacteria bacterium]|nr:MAG: hypothetical protein DMF67_16870 [Acidobacteriota bacterium]